MSDETTITTEKRGHVFLMGLDRPKKRNAFTLAMLHELARAFQKYEATEELRCAVLFAHGDHFTAGLDLADVGPAVAGGAPLIPKGAVDPMGLLEPRRTKPLVIAVQGYCYTIGLELVLGADLRLAAEGTRFAQLEVKRGIMPFGGATFRLPRIAGWGNAMRYLLTGDELDAAEALRIGIVQEVLPREQLMDRALALAERVAAQAPLAVRACLESARLCEEKGQDAALARLMEQTRSLMASEDAFEGMMSFVERREAKFKGR